MSQKAVNTQLLDQLVKDISPHIVLVSAQMRKDETRPRQMEGEGLAWLVR